MLLVALALAQDVVIREDLHTSSSATDYYGGTFTGTGWRIDDSNSRQMWDFGTQVNRGSISVVIDGITLDNLTGDNNHLIELFDAGGHFSGATRAINVRVYGSDNDPDHGDIKLKVWEPTGYAEARGGHQVWDGLPHLWTVTWDETNCILYRDGVVVVDLDVTGLDLRVGTLWLPLMDWMHGYSAPIGAEYSRLDLTAWEPREEELPPPDGLLPVQDVGVLESLGSRMYDDIDDLPVEAATERSYLMFDLSAVRGTVTSAILTLRARGSSSSAGDGGVVYAVSDTTWSEDTLTWAARPALGTQLGSFGAVSAGDTLEIDVTAGTRAGGLVAYAVAGGGDNGVHLCSKKDDDACAATLALVVDEREPEEEEEEVEEEDTQSDTDAVDTDTVPAADTDGDAPRENHRRLPIPGAESGCGCDAGVTGGSWIGIMLALCMRRRR